MARKRTRRRGTSDESMVRRIETSVQTASMMVLGSVALAVVAGITLLLIWQSLMAAIEVLPLR